MLVHGPAGCVTSFGYTRAYPGTSRKYRPMYISTNINQENVVYGASDKLRNALIKVDKTMNPKLIIVLTNCCTDIIGEKVGVIIKDLTSC